MYTQTCCKVKVMHPVSRTAWVSGNIAVGFGGAVQASLRSESLFGRIVMVYALLRPRSQLQRLGLTVCKTQVRRPCDPAESILVVSVSSWCACAAPLLLVVVAFVVGNSDIMADSCDMVQHCVPCARVMCACMLVWQCGPICNACCQSSAIFQSLEQQFGRSVDCSVHVVPGWLL